MLKFLYWWHSYRLIANLLQGSRALLKVHLFNPSLNLATINRTLGWCISTVDYIDLGPFKKLADRQIEKTKKAVANFDWTNANDIDGITLAWQAYNHNDVPQQIESVDSNEEV